MNDFILRSNYIPPHLVQTLSSGLKKKKTEFPLTLSNSIFRSKNKLQPLLTNCLTLRSILTFVAIYVA
jgi:hypothetical protein